MIGETRLAAVLHTTSHRSNSTFDRRHNRAKWLETTSLPWYRAFIIIMPTLRIAFPQALVLRLLEETVPVALFLTMIRDLAFLITLEPLRWLQTETERT